MENCGKQVQRAGEVGAFFFGPLCCLVFKCRIGPWGREGGESMA